MSDSPKPFIDGVKLLWAGGGAVVGAVVMLTGHAIVLGRSLERFDRNMAAIEELQKLAPKLATQEKVDAIEARCTASCSATAAALLASDYSAMCPRWVTKGVLRLACDFERKRPQ